MIKKLMIILALALSLMSVQEAAARRKMVPRAELKALVRDYRAYDDFDGICLGSMATSFVRGAGKMAARIDGGEDMDEMLALLSAVNGVKGIVVADYSDCNERVQREFTRKVAKLLNGVELLMDVKDEGDNVQFYGYVTEDGDTLEDLVISAPGDGALVCLFGKIRMSAIMEVMELQRQNARSPMLVTELPMVIELREEQL